MRSALLALTLSAATLTTGVLGASCATTSPSSAYGAPAGPFVDDLRPYGDWWWQPGVGWVFTPWVGAGWAPYTVGRWGWSALDGWVWLSQEPFGWATYHYGRWDLLGGRWAWIPGDVWAPAWVSWRRAPGYIGWSPIGVNRWVVVRDVHMLDPVASRIVRGEVARDVLSSSRVVHTPVRGTDGRMLNPGPSPQVVGRAIGRPVEPLDRDLRLRAIRERDEARARSAFERRDPVGQLRQRERVFHDEVFGGELRRETARERAIEEARRDNMMRRRSSLDRDPMTGRASDEDDVRPAPRTKPRPRGR